MAVRFGRKKARLISQIGVGLFGGLASCMVACAPEDAAPEPTESVTSELITRIPGSTLTSPNVNKMRTYLSVRNIGTLENLGAISGALASLAYRVDGVIGAKPADGRFSVAEILKMEDPRYLRTLYPDEKAALPALWALLETTNDSPTPISVSPLSPFATVDASTAATMPLKPPKLDISSLPATLQPAARRLQMIVDSDSDPTSITEVDIDDPLAFPDPWTQTEIDDFKAIKQVFIARAGTTLKSEVNVPVPSMATSTVATWGSAALQVTQGFEYGETRGASFSRGSSDGSLDISLFAHRVSNATLTAPGGQKIVIIDETTETETVLGAGDVTWPRSGVATVEVWSGGTRVSSFRATLPKIEPVDERIDLKDYVDYNLIAGGRPLNKNVVSASVRYDTYYTQNHATYAYEANPTPIPAGASTAALSVLATPKPALLPGRYEVSVPALGTGKCKLEISPQGVVTFTRPGGMTIRSRIYIWTYGKFDSQYPDRLRGLFDPRTNNLMVFFDGGSTLFNGAITDVQRTG